MVIQSFLNLRTKLLVDDTILRWVFFTNRPYIYIFFSVHIIQNGSNFMIDQRSVSVCHLCETYKLKI